MAIPVELQIPYVRLIAPVRPEGVNPSTAVTGKPPALISVNHGMPSPYLYPFDTGSRTPGIRSEERITSVHGLRINMDIFSRMRAGEPIRPTDEGHGLVLEAYREAAMTVMEMNSAYRTPGEVLSYLRRLTTGTIDDSAFIVLPFHTDFGRNITIGRDVFINSNCTMLDQGGITVHDSVKLGPNVTLVTSNHPLDPSDRKAVVSTPIVLERNCWIGAGSIVLPGVTVGEDSVVGAGSVVTRDVEPRTVVAGSPARVIRRL